MDGDGNDAFVSFLMRAVYYKRVEEKNRNVVGILFEGSAHIALLKPANGVCIGAQEVG